MSNQNYNIMHSCGHVDTWHVASVDAANARASEPCRECRREVFVHGLDTESLAKIESAGILIRSGESPFGGYCSVVRKMDYASAHQMLTDVAKEKLYEINCRNVRQAAKNL